MKYFFWGHCQRNPREIGGQYKRGIEWTTFSVTCSLKLSLSRVQLSVTVWTVAYQAPPSRGFSRQENWSGLPFPSPGDLPNPGIEPRSPSLEADILTSEPPGKQSNWDLNLKWMVKFALLNLITINII